MMLDIQTLRASHRRFAPKEDALASRFYEVLFERYPHMLSLFEHVRWDEQRAKLTRALALIVRHIENPEFMRPYLKGLGAIHVAYGVLPEHYPAFGECLLVALRATAGSAWSEQEERAWRGAADVIAEIMSAGAAQLS
jgi:hemoglobin-like flavoprotein